MRFFLASLSTICLFHVKVASSWGLPGPPGLPGHSSSSTPVMDHTVICEGEKGWIQCKQYEAIKINKVFWGRDDDVTCSNVPVGLDGDSLCETNSENSLWKVNDQCKNEQACEIVASNIFFDNNSCGNVYKFLKVWYECVHDDSQAVDVLRNGGLLFQEVGVVGEDGSPGTAASSRNYASGGLVSLILFVGLFAYYVNASGGRDGFRRFYRGRQSEGYTEIV